MNIQNNSTSIKNFEVQVSQIVNLIYECIIGTISSNTIQNEQDQKKAKHVQEDLTEYQTDSSRRDVIGVNSHIPKPIHIELSNQVPRHVNFIKELRPNEVRWYEKEIVMITKVLPRKLPIKQ